jgi:hypothetical protein
LKEGANLEDFSVDGRILLKWNFRQSEGKEKKKWQAVVIPVMNIRVT